MGSGAVKNTVGLPLFCIFSYMQSTLTEQQSAHIAGRTTNVIEVLRSILYGICYIVQAM